MQGLRKWSGSFGGIGAWLRSVLPERCVFCGMADTQAGICVGCRDDLPGRDVPRCPVCAVQMPAREVCGECLRKPPAFQRVVTAVSYEFPVDAAIQRLKYAHDLALVVPLARLVFEKVAADPHPDLLLPMPLAPARLRDRGFNQAAELARCLRALLNLPVSLEAAVRTRETAPQASLPLDERASNIRGAFSAQPSVAGLHVAVVDDVLTTGATLNELAKALRRAGAREVTGWIVARTPRTR